MSERGAEGELRRRAAATETVQAKPDLGRSETRTYSTPLPNHGGYWTFIITAVFILFILYITGKGELTKWIDILVPAPPPAPTVVGAGQSPNAGGSQAPASAAKTSASTPAAPNAGGSSASTTTPAPSNTVFPIWNWVVNSLSGVK